MCGLLDNLVLQPALVGPVAARPVAELGDPPREGGVLAVLAALVGVVHERKRGERKGEDDGAELVRVSEGLLERSRLVVDSARRGGGLVKATYPEGFALVGGRGVVAVGIMIVVVVASTAAGESPLGRDRGQERQAERGVRERVRVMVRVPLRGANEGAGYGGAAHGVWEKRSVCGSVGWCCD